MSESALIAAADHAARFWSYPVEGPLKPRDEEYMRMFCRMLLETFNPYKPSVIVWPKLDDAARERLVNLPFWDIAVQTEGRARLRIQSFARRITVEPLRSAFERMAFEENRHKEVLSHLVAAYGITLAPEPPYVEPRDPEWGWLVTGYSECIDSFFAFGLFELARRSGFFPPELVETFEPVIQEEGRHILFFNNWVKWYHRTMPWWRRPWFWLKTLWVWAYLIWERIGVARDVGGGKQDANFTAKGSEAVVGELDLGTLLDVCLAENDRRLSGYDPRLAKPMIMPRLARLARLFIRPRRQRTA